MTSGYPEYMLESIKLVDESRDRRLQERFEMISLQEREEILQNYHPDYKQSGKRPIRVGPNKGDFMPHEVVDLLEAEPLLDPADVDLSQVDFDLDILIIGGGGAGMTAALWAYYSGIKPQKLLIIQKLRLKDSNSVMSQGGIQAADKPKMSR